MRRGASLLSRKDALQGPHAQIQLPMYHIYITHKTRAVMNLKNLPRIQSFYPTAVPSYTYTYPSSHSLYSPLQGGRSPECCIPLYCTFQNTYHVSTYHLLIHEPRDVYIHIYIYILLYLLKSQRQLILKHKKKLFSLRRT